MFGPMPSMRRSSIFSVKDGVRSDPDIASTFFLSIYHIGFEIIFLIFIDILFCLKCFDSLIYCIILNISTFFLYFFCLFSKI
jgi:hypothetical protein